MTRFSGQVLKNYIHFSEFATNILHHGRFSLYPVEPIIRHGEPVQLLEIPDNDILFKKAAETCKVWQKKGLETIAVVCQNQESAQAAANILRTYIEVIESDLEKAVFGNGIMVLPVEYTKGLEFDAVLILNPTRKEYPVNDGHAKLLYVAATRALHELCILHTGNLTGLIADPLPDKTAPEKPVPEKPVPKKAIQTSNVSANRHNVQNQAMKPTSDTDRQNLTMPLQQTVGDTVSSRIRY